MKRTLANAVLFQLMWFVCVQGHNALALVATVLALLIHARFWVTKHAEWQLIAGFTVMGFLFDSLINTAGWILFSGSLRVTNSTVPVVIAPVWLLCLWLMFATTLCHSLLWLNRYPWVSVLLACSAVPLSYYAGGHLSGSVLSQPVVIPLLAEAAIWAILLPSGLRVAGKIMDNNSPRMNTND
ncbi:DUF2878 domain-containing protein [Kistimonas scapharcae]|uniref:DUF2878 domain-containing protein n=1 Tax=Kistimonas scapharcae TaxID=1036133 RepID=A0ABP8V0T4_9GAMM